MKIETFYAILVIVLCFVYNSYSESICEKIIKHHQRNYSLQTQEYKSLLEQLKNTTYDDCIEQLEPNYVWAQNMSFIMIKFEFDISTRTSCSQLITSERKVTYQGFQLSQYCLQSQKVIRYRININTYKNLNPHFSQWKSTQLNGLILQALKSPAPYFWPKLYSSATKLSNKPKIWWQLQQKQEQTVQRYMGLLEIDQSQFQISSYVKKMRKRPQKIQKISSSDTQFYCNEGSPFLLGSWL